jgi:hypothetical protein
VRPSREILLPHAAPDLSLRVQRPQNFPLTRPLLLSQNGHSSPWNFRLPRPAPSFFCCLSFTSWRRRVSDASTTRVTRQLATPLVSPYHLLLPTGTTLTRLSLPSLFPLASPSPSLTRPNRPLLLLLTSLCFAFSLGLSHQQPPPTRLATYQRPLTCSPSTTYPSLSHSPLPPHARRPSPKMQGVPPSVQIYKATYSSVPVYEVSLAFPLADTLDHR